MHYLEPINKGLDEMLVNIKKIVNIFEQTNNIDQQVVKKFSLIRAVSLTGTYFNKLPEPTRPLTAEKRIMIYNLRLIFTGIVKIFESQVALFVQELEKMMILKERELVKREKKLELNVQVPEDQSSSELVISLPVQKKPKSNKEPSNNQLQDESIKGIYNNLNDIHFGNMSLINELISEIEPQLLHLDNTSEMRSSNLNIMSNISEDEMKIRSSRGKHSETTLQSQRLSLDVGEHLLEVPIVTLPPDKPVYPNESPTRMIIHPVQIQPEELAVSPQLSNMCASIKYINENVVKQKIKKRKEVNKMQGNTIKNIFRRYPFWNTEQLNKFLDVTQRYVNIAGYDILAHVQSDDDDDNIFLMDDFDVGLKPVKFNFLVFDEEDEDEIYEQDIMILRAPSNRSTISKIDRSSIPAAQLTPTSHMSNNEEIMPEIPVLDLIPNIPPDIHHFEKDLAEVSVIVEEMINKTVEENAENLTLCTEQVGEDSAIRAEIFAEPELPLIEPVKRKRGVKNKRKPSITKDKANQNGDSITIDEIYLKETTFEKDIEEVPCPPPSPGSVEFQKNILDIIEELFLQKDAIKFTEICSKDETRLLAAKTFSTLLDLCSGSMFELVQESTDPDYVFICKPDMAKSINFV